MDRLYLIVCLVVGACSTSVPSGLSQKKGAHTSRQNRTYDQSWKGRNKGVLPEQSVFLAAFDLSRNSTKGPHAWKDKYPACNGKHQSPVDIDTDLVQCDSSLHDFVYSGYDTIPSTPVGVLLMVAETQGVVFEVLQNDIKISNDCLSSPYSLYVISFWINVDTVDGEEAQLYLGLDHWNSHKYASVLEAEQQPDGIVALEVPIMAAAKKEDIDQEFSDAVDDIIKAAGSKTFVPTFPMSSFLPSDRVYYKYPGSYPTPPCYESITLNVFRQPIYLAKSQIENFFQAFFGTKVRKQKFGRPPQPLNDRVVTSSCN